jgi:antitoxin HicB
MICNGIIARLHQEVPKDTNQRFNVSQKTVANIVGGMMKREHLGSDFDDFLEEEGLLAEAEAVAVKRVVAYQIAELMEETQLTKTAMARRMETSRAALDRLLDPTNESVTLHTLERAALVLGKRLRIEFV